MLHILKPLVLYERRWARFVEYISTPSYTRQYTEVNGQLYNQAVLQSREGPTRYPCKRRPGGTQS